MNPSHSRLRGTRLAITSPPQWATSTPSSVPAVVMISASANIWRAMLHRVAPSAMRTASSRRLAMPRASMRLARLAQAIRRIAIEAASMNFCTSRTRSARPDSEMSLILNGAPRC